MRPILIVAALAGVLLTGGCQALQVANAPMDPTAAQKAVFAVKSGYAVTLRLGVAYNDRGRCGLPTSPKLCSDAAVVATIRKADAAAYAAIDTAESASRSLKDPTVLQAALTAAQSSLAAYQRVIAVYSPEGATP